MEEMRKRGRHLADVSLSYITCGRHYGGNAQTRPPSCRCVAILHHLWIRLVDLRDLMVPLAF